MGTKIELDNYLKSLNKKPGNYSLDELYQIGLLHKDLPQKDKNWLHLSTRVGYPGEPGSYRNFVYRRQLKEATIKKVLENNVAEIVGTAETTNNSDYEELYKQKVAINDIYATYRSNLRTEARLNTLKELIEENIKQLPKLPKINDVISKVDKTSEAILLLSDLHLGAECCNFYNTYNIEVAKIRLNTLALNVINYCQKFKIMRLNVVGLGDFIHGIIHISGRINSQIDVVQQVILASEYLSEFLCELQEAAPEVLYRSCTDNHSRLSPSKEEVLEGENLSKLIDFYLEARLSGTKIIFPKDNLDDSLGKFKLMNGKNVVYAHGHLDNINLAFQHFVGATREFVDYMLLGHYHCEKAKSFQGTTVFVNGSICGTEQYALSKRLFSDPSQTLLLFDSNNVLNISIRL